MCLCKSWEARAERHESPVQLFFREHPVCERPSLLLPSLALSFSLSLSLLYVMGLCITLCAGYFCTWPVRYTNGRRTRAELSVATRSRSGTDSRSRSCARARSRARNDVDDVHKRVRTLHTHTQTYIYPCTHICIRTLAHVDRCTCPCPVRSAVTLNRHQRDNKHNFFEKDWDFRKRCFRLIF